MRLLWVSHLVPYPPKGGVLQRSFNLLREVARYHTVDLVAFVQRPFLHYLSSDPQEALRIAERELSTFCSSVHFTPLPQEERRGGRTGLLLSSLVSPRPYTVNWLASPSMAALIGQRLGKARYHAAHLDTFSLGHYLPDLGNVPAVMNHHNIESHMMMRRAANERHFAKRLYMRQEGWKIANWERRYGVRCALHTTCSRLDSARLLEIAPALSGRIAEVPNGVDLDYFKPGATPQVANRLLFAGRLSAYANRRAAIYICRTLWPALKQAVPGLSMDLIGAEPPGEAVRLSQEDPAFRVHGFVDDVRPFLDAAALYLCPITDGGGTKLKMLDALAMGKAIVADPIACEGIEVTDGIDVALANDTQSYVEKIVLLLSNDAIRRRMGLAARALIEREYGYAAIGRTLATLHEMAAHGREMRGEATATGCLPSTER